MDLSLQILLFVALLILLAKAVGSLSARLGLPLVLGELMAGVILGPTLFDVWRLPWFSAPATGALALSLPAVVKILAQLGVVILMFLAGLDTDIEMMKRSVGPAFWAAMGGVVLPFAGAAILARGAGFGWNEAIFIGAVLTATSVSITAQTLMNLGRLRSKVGSTILGAAVIDDVLGLLVLSFVIAAEAHRSVDGQGSSPWFGMTMTVTRAVAFLLVSFWLGPRLMRWVFKSDDRFREPHTSAAVAVGLGFISAFLAEYGGGMAAITGSYLAGLFIAGTPMRARLVEDLRAMSNSFFGPLFFVSIGLEINARQLGGRFGFFVLLFLVAVGGKVLGCGLGAWFRGMTGRDSVAVGVGMIPRGEVGLITATVGWTSGLISPPVYSLVVVLVLATTLITPLLLRLCLPAAPVATAHGLPPTPPLIAELPEER